MRLTEKDGSYKEYLTDHHGTTYGEARQDNKCTQKLSQLEDIEDELGIDLITLCNAIKNGFIARWYFGWEYCHCDIGELNIKIDYKNKKITNDYTADWYFNDYGKTWALTREELKDDE